MDAAQPGERAGPVPRRLRADAERNAALILDRAPALLARHPAASMAQVAQAAGLARATLYRHFPNREDLVRAIHRRALADATAAIAAAEPASGPVPDALQRVFDGLLAVGDRFWFLTREPEPDDPATRDAQRGTGAALIELIERGQAEGVLDATVPATFAARLAGGLVVSAVAAVAEGEIDRRRAAITSCRTFISGLQAA